MGEQHAEHAVKYCVHLNDVAHTVVQLLDHPSISAGDLNSCLVALNFTDFLKLLNTAPLLH
jgi:hypothetical protein